MVKPFKAVLRWILKGLKDMLDVTALNAKLDALVAVVANVQTDYTNLKAEIEALKALVDPEAQAKIDAAVAKLDASLAQLTVLDESVPSVPDPGTPA